jgi:hypothetical protein
MDRGRLCLPRLPLGKGLSCIKCRYPCQGFLSSPQFISMRNSEFPCDNISFLLGIKTSTPEKFNIKETKILQLWIFMMRVPIFLLSITGLFINIRDTDFSPFMQCIIQNRIQLELKYGYFTFPTSQLLLESQISPIVRSNTVFNVKKV